MQYRTVESIAFTVDAIVQSPGVGEYMIGITGRPSAHRKREYARLRGYEHLVVLADNLAAEDARELEEHLQGYISEVKRLGVYRKYERSWRDGPYYPNCGDRDRIFSVYMAWQERKR